MYLAKNSPFQLPLQLDHVTQFWPSDTEQKIAGDFHGGQKFLGEQRRLGGFLWSIKNLVLSLTNTFYDRGRVPHSA